VAAEQNRVSRYAEIATELDVVERENQLEVKRAKLAATENQARERAAMAGQIARAAEEEIVGVPIDPQLILIALPFRLGALWSSIEAIPRPHFPPRFPPRFPCDLARPRFP
jgi:hypothetical protein